MGKIPAGIMGGVKGKVGGVIGASWRGINYIKTYVIPTDPQSEGQIYQRNKMVCCNKIQKQALTGIIQPLWNPIAQYKSGIHLWLSENLKLVTSSTDFANILMAKGALQKVFFEGDPYTEYNGITGEWTVHYTPDAAGNGLNTDYVGCLVYNQDLDQGYISMGSAQREDGSLTLNIGTGHDIYDCRSYIFAYRLDGDVYLMSDSENYIPVV